LPRRPIAMACAAPRNDMAFFTNIPIRS
jgi:hypothetical protein